MAPGARGPALSLARYQSAKLAEIDRGREIIVLETSREWVHVEANLTEERTVTGWVLDKGVVRTSTPNGDKILYGEAVDSEDQASRRRRAQRGSPGCDASLLPYGRIFPYLAAGREAMYRSADIRWQIEKADVSSRPSSREREAFLREGMEERFMKEVIKKFPGTKWADLAAFHLIDNKLCGDWQGSSKCPVKESEIYEKYATEHPQSPAVAEALYDAAWRWSALIEIYKTEEEPKKSEEARAKAIALAQKSSIAICLRGLGSPRPTAALPDGAGHTDLRKFHSITAGIWPQSRLRNPGPNNCRKFSRLAEPSMAPPRWRISAILSHHACRRRA